MRPFSTDIRLAWAVLERARLWGRYVSVIPRPDGRWSAGTAKALNPRGDGSADGYDDTAFDWHVVGSTTAQVICLAVVVDRLDAASAREHVVSCMFCETTEAEGHLPRCHMGRAGVPRSPFADR